MKAYTEEEINEAFDFILAKIEYGESVRYILREYSDMPNRDTFYKWLKTKEGFADRYARACEHRQEMIFDEILEIADESNPDIHISDEGGVRINGEAIQRSKLKIDARKWVLSKMNPTKYGDKVDITSDGEKLAMTPEERELRIQELKNKLKK